LGDKYVGDWISADPAKEERVKVVAIDGDNNRTKDSREDEAEPSVSSPAARAREFDQAATKPSLKGFVTFSDAVDSKRANVNYCLHEE
jgi:hypothetical protein